MTDEQRQGNDASWPGQAFAKKTSVYCAASDADTSEKEKSSPRESVSQKRKSSPYECYCFLADRTIGQVVKGLAKALSYLSPHTALVCNVHVQQNCDGVGIHIKHRTDCGITIHHCSVVQPVKYIFTHGGESSEFRDYSSVQKRPSIAVKVEREEENT